MKDFMDFSGALDGEDPHIAGSRQLYNRDGLQRRRHYGRGKQYMKT